MNKEDNTRVVCRSSGGLSILEVLVAITILAMAIGSIYTAITFASRVGQHNVERTMALNLAIQRMDEVKDAAYGSITTAKFSSEPGIVVGNYPVRFNRSVTILTSNYKTVTVRVAWSHLGWPFTETEEVSTIISP